jgi:hypothetical protein
LPDRAAPIAGAKPPVFSLPYEDLGHPEEVETFGKLIREIRRQSTKLDAMTVLLLDTYIVSILFKRTIPPQALL